RYTPGANIYTSTNINAQSTPTFTYITPQTFSNLGSYYTSDSIVTSDTTTSPNTMCMNGDNYYITQIAQDLVYSFDYTATETLNLLLIGGGAAGGAAGGDGPTSNIS